MTTVLYIKLSERVICITKMHYIMLLYLITFLINEENIIMKSKVFKISENKNIGEKKSEQIGINFVFFF